MNEKDLSKNLVDVLPTKCKKALTSTAWFHSTTFKSFLNLHEKGVIVDYNRGSLLDFGFGFYLTTTADLAESYIRRLFTWDPSHPIDLGNIDNMPVIIEYNVLPINWFESMDYATKVFPSFDDEFAEFVFLNRTNTTFECNAHTYDAVYGVMSDSRPTQLFMGLEVGEYSKHEVLAALKKDNRMKQLSLHNQELCDTLIMKRAYLYNFQTDERKELDINE